MARPSATGVSSWQGLVTWGRQGCLYGAWAYQGNESCANKGNQEVVWVEVRVRSPGQAVWVQTPALTLTGYVTSGMDPSLSEGLCPPR